MKIFTQIAAIALTACSQSPSAPSQEEVEQPRPLAARTSPRIAPENSKTASEPQLQKTAISCDNNGTSEIYIIDDLNKTVVYYNQQTKEVSPWCSGECNWEFTENSISFENENNGFVIAGNINRSEGEMIVRFSPIAQPDSLRKSCHKIPLPAVAKNKF